MLKRLFGISLPEPSSEILRKTRTIIDCSLDSELVSAAYEPRFSLLAMGTARGRLIVVNDRGETFTSHDEIKTPILSLLPLINSSSFLGVSSKYLFANHPNRIRAERKGLKGLSSMSESSVKSMLIHWIIAKDRVVPRCLVVDQDIIDVAVPPGSPQYAVVATAQGTLMGFSIEDMKFTRLYVNIFEGRPIRSIFCEKGMTFFICHEQIDRLELKEMEFTDVAKIQLQTFDKVDDHAAGIGVDGVPALYGSMFNTLRQKEHLALEPEEKATYVGMISGSKWISILRKDGGDRVMIGKKEKLKLPCYAIPKAIIKYEDPYKRQHAREIIVIDEFGSRINVKTGERQETFPTDVRQYEFACADEEYVRLFSEDVICEIHGGSILGFKENQIGIPVACVAGKLIVVENMSEICAVNPTSGEKEVLESAPILRIHKTTEAVDFVCDGGVVFTVKLAEKEITLVNNGEFYPQKDILMWRHFCGSLIFITDENELVYGDEKVHVCSKKKSILFAEVVGPDGKRCNDGFILIVTSRAILVFVVQEDKLARARKVKTHKPIREASLTPEGTLLVRTENQLLLFVLPDPSFDPLLKVPIGDDEAGMLIPGEGFVLFGMQKFLIYRDRASVQLFDQEKPSLEAPHTNAFMSLFSGKEPTAQEVDEGFQNRRHGRAMANMAQTNEIMQQNIMRAQERGELLSEMEVKSENIMKGAQKFARLASELKDKKWWF